MNHPAKDKKIIFRNQKETLLQQKGKVIWLTGLPCSGKTTLAVRLEKELFDKGFLIRILDGDNVRTGINNNLGFSEADRLENIRRIAEISKLFVECGVITINGFVSPTESLRTMAKEIIGDEDFIEVYVNSPLEVCEQRDVKGMYRKARAGMIKEFTGVSSVFEEPLHADIEIRTDLLNIEQSVMKILEYILPQIKYDNV
ncbi:MAG: adenylyl-sulfate kinase [Lentimicrobiaceae bacterium]|nr:adenylyl-sulfate kinase [Lentimicrobiaceae bacterium]